MKSDMTYCHSKYTDNQPYQNCFCFSVLLHFFLIFLYSFSAGCLGQSLQMTIRKIKATERRQDQHPDRSIKLEGKRGKGLSKL